MPTIRVDTPGSNKVTSGFLGRCVANRSELEILKSHGGEAEIIKHCAHLVDNLDDADNSGLVEMGAGCFAGHGGQHFHIGNLGRRVTRWRCAEEVLCECLKQRLVGFKDSSIFGGNLDGPDDPVGIAVPLSTGCRAMGGDFAVPEGAEEVTEFIGETLLCPPIGRNIGCFCKGGGGGRCDGWC